jgi:hypothetical protein
MILHLVITLVSVLALSLPCHAAVVFETNFDSVQTWNPSGSAACWQDTIPIEGGSGACGAPAGPLPKLGSSPTIFNDFRLLAPQCSSIPAMHIGSGSDIEAVKSGANFSPFGGSGKSYVHFYEPCMSSSGGWGSDGLLGAYFGKTTGYSELYVQAKVKFQPGFAWAAGSQQKLMHIMHFNEDYNQGVLQAYNMFAYNLPDLVPGIYYNKTYSPNPQFYLHTSHTNGTTGGRSSFRWPKRPLERPGEMEFDATLRVLWTRKEFFRAGGKVDFCRVFCRKSSAERHFRRDRGGRSRAAPWTLKKEKAQPRGTMPARPLRGIRKQPPIRPPGSRCGALRRWSASPGPADLIS